LNLELLAEYSKAIAFPIKQRFLNADLFLAKIYFSV